jgi:hypothetical protein
MRFAVDIKNPAGSTYVACEHLIDCQRKTMSQKTRINAELQPEVLALKHKIKARFMEGRVPAKKRRHVWLIILLMTAVWIGAYLEYGHTPSWPVVWHRGLLGACAVAGMLLVSYLDSRRKQQEAARWYRQLDAVVDINDFQDRDCLYEYLKPDERLRLIRSLQQMPHGSRSLREALKKICPVLIDDVI